MKTFSNINLSRESNKRVGANHKANWVFLFGLSAIPFRVVLVGSPLLLGEMR